MNYLLVFLGGGLGSCLRFGIARSMAGSSTQFPIATLLTNILACLVLGYGISLVGADRLSDQHRLLLLTGFCGGFSTFSTFSAEVLELWTSGRGGMALLYALVSVASGIGIIFWLTK